MVDSLLGLNIISVNCGGQHADVLSSAGTVHTWGRGGYGRLGHGWDRPSWRMGLRGLKRQAVEINCGFAYTIAVVERGQMWVWGAGDNR